MHFDTLTLTLSLCGSSYYQSHILGGLCVLYLEGRWLSIVCGSSCISPPGSGLGSIDLNPYPCGSYGQYSSTIHQQPKNKEEINF